MCHLTTQEDIKTVKTLFKSDESNMTTSKAQLLSDCGIIKTVIVVPGSNPLVLKGGRRWFKLQLRYLKQSEIQKQKILRTATNC